MPIRSRIFDGFPVRGFAVLGTGLALGVWLAAGLCVVGCRDDRGGSVGDHSPDAHAGDGANVDSGPTSETRAKPEPEPEPEPKPKPTDRFVVVKGEAMLHAGAEGDGVPGSTKQPDLGGLHPGVVLRMLDQRDGRMLVETVSSSATPTDGCGVGIDGLDPFRLRFWVDEAARLEVVTGRFRSSYPDVTTVELLAGTPVRQIDGGTWVADVWGTTIDLARTPQDRGLQFDGLDHLTGSPKGHLAADTKLRVGDALVPSFMLEQDTEGIVHFGEDRGMYWVQLGCVQLLAATDGGEQAEMPVALGLAGGGRGGSPDPELGMHRLATGAPLYWRDGRVAGEVREPHLMAGEQDTGGVLPSGPKLVCYRQPYAHRRSSLQLCVDPQAGGVEPLEWLAVRVSSAKWPKSLEKTGAISAVDPQTRATAAHDLIRRCVGLALDHGITLVESAKLRIELRTKAGHLPTSEIYEVARVDGLVVDDDGANRAVHACVTKTANEALTVSPGFAEATYRLGD